MERHSLDALLVTSLLNIRYQCGFTGSDGVLLLTSSGGWFLTDSRYTTQAQSEVSSFHVTEYRNKLDSVVERINEAGCRRVGIESGCLTVAIYNELSERLPRIDLVPLGSDIDELRTLKDAEEIELLKDVCSIASDAFLEILPAIRPGALEQDLAFELEIAMRRHGADDKAFDFIVASGERGALPHGRASNKAIRPGDFVTFDFGAKRLGYNSDETVTLAVGDPNPQLLKIYETVKEAHDRALDAVKPGVELRELDSIARSFINEKGYGAYFGHGLGHGIGLDVHEKPVVSFRSDVRAEAGMVFTVEPGIYIPGLGGVRIEDTLVVTSDGYRLLTKISKELQVV